MAIMNPTLLRQCTQSLGYECLEVEGLLAEPVGAYNVYCALVPSPKMRKCLLEVSAMLSRSASRWYGGLVMPEGNSPNITINFEGEPSNMDGAFHTPQYLIPNGTGFPTTIDLSRLQPDAQRTLTDLVTLRSNWDAAIHALEFLNDWCRSPGELVHFAPWLPRTLECFETYKGGDEAKMKRTLLAVKPSGANAKAMSRRLITLCRSVEGLRAQAVILREGARSRPCEPGMAMFRVTASNVKRDPEFDMLLEAERAGRGYPRW